MTILKSGDQILDLVHRWGARNSKEVDFGEPHYGKGKAGSISIDVPFETPICRENYGGSAVEMIVPAEEKHREMALKLIGSDHPWDRAQGAGILGNLPESAASVSLLRKMLDDAGESQGCYSGYELAEFTYPARNAAWAALIYLGHKPEAKPVSRRSPTREEQEKYLRDYWNRLIADALGKQWKVNSIEPNAAPPGWTRSQGPDGFVLKCGTQEDSLPALLPVYVMPKEWLSSHSLAWAAVSAEGSLDDLMRHVARSASLEVPKATDTPAAYLGVKEFGAQGACHVFVLPTCPAEIKEKLVRHWELKIVEAPKP